ncbi:ThuA domain-containing protein [Paenibacillus sp. D51F]
MTRSAKALLLGDQVHAAYHPLEPAEQELRELLMDMQVEATEDYSCLSTEGLAGYDLLISYSDQWRVKKSRRQVAALLRYVSGGGGLLVVHNGISLQADPELAQLIGGQFTGHPDYGPLAFSVKQDAEAHPVMQGIRAFTMGEEPYRFTMDPIGPAQILMEYSHEGSSWPAAWAHEFGLGKVVYLMPGHHRQSFRHPEYRRLIVQAAAWASHA